MQPQSEAPGGAASELRADAKKVSASAADRIHSELDARKGSAATQVQSVSAAIDQAAGGLDDNAPAWLKSALEKGAQQVQRFADSLEQKDSREMVDQVRTYARDNPGTFLAACAAIGFAGARVFKAGASDAQTGEFGANQPASPTSDQPLFRSSGDDNQTTAPSRGEFV